MVLKIQPNNSKYYEPFSFCGMGYSVWQEHSFLHLCGFQDESLSHMLILNIGDPI